MKLLKSVGVRQNIFILYILRNQWADSGGEGKCKLADFFAPFFPARLHYPLPPLSAPGSPRMLSVLSYAAFSKGAFLWDDPDQDQVIRDHSDHGRSNELMSTDESTLDKDSSVHLIYHDPNDHSDHLSSSGTHPKICLSSWN